jgi:amylosucrase
MRRLAQARRTRRALHGRGRSQPLWTGDPHVFALLREHAGERMLLLASFSAQRRPVALSLLADHGVELRPQAAEPDGRPLRTEGDALVLEPYQHLWIDGDPHAP